MSANIWFPKEEAFEFKGFAIYRLKSKEKYFIFTKGRMFDIYFGLL